MLPSFGGHSISIATRFGKEKVEGWKKGGYGGILISQVFTEKFRPVLG